MADYTLDTSKVNPNPYSFKADPKAADEFLKRDLSTLAKFLECVAPEAGQIEEAWQRYQDTHKAAGVLRLAFSIRHVLEVQSVVQAIDECKKEHELTAFTGFQVLLHLGLIQLIETGAHESQFQWMLRRLKKEPRPTITLSDGAVGAKAIRRFLTELENEYNAERGTAKSLVRALSEGLNEGDRAALLNGWAFTDPYGLGEKVDLETLQHLHCRRRDDRFRARLEAATSDDDRKHYRAMLSSGPCMSSCRPATGNDLAELFPELVNDHLYRMRNELVHAASPIGMVHSPSKAALKWMQKGRRGVPIVHGGGSLLDGYFVEGGRMVTYQATMGIETIKVIMRRCMWNRLRGTVFPAAKNPIPAP